MRQRERAHSRGPEGLAEPAEGGRHLRHGERHPVRPHGRGSPVGDGLCPAAGALPRVPAGEPAHQPVSAGPQGPAANRRPAAVRLRWIAGDGGDGSDPLSHQWLPGDGAVRRTGAGQKSAGAAGGPEDPGGAGSGGGALPSAERGTHYAGYSVRRVRVPGPTAGGADGGSADHAAGRQGQKGPPQAGQQSAETAILRRPDPRRSGGASAPWHRPLRGDDPDAHRRGGEGLHQDRLCRQRLPVCAGHGAGSGEQVYRGRGGYRAHPAQ